MSVGVDYFTEQIIQRLNSDFNGIKAEYNKNKEKLGFGFVAIDNLLPLADVEKISGSFSPDNSAWREMDSFREKKLTTKQYQQFDPILKDITFAFQDQKVVNLVSDLTGIKKQIPDSHLYAGGLSMMRTHDFLDPHIDNSHDLSRKHYRRLNLLYYVTKDWTISDGGHLQLWDKAVKNPTTVESKFNRLVLMETNKFSWHSVSEVVKENSFRKCVSNYYFSEESPSGETYYHVTSFMAKPDQIFKRMFCHIDNTARRLVRAIKPSGIGKVDIYSGKKNEN